MIKINTIVELKNGLKGKVVGQLENGEYMISSGQGGQISYFREKDLLSK